MPTFERYKINIFWSVKDDVFIAECPAFEGLAVVGSTRAEALSEAEAAIATYIEIYGRDNIPLPIEDNAGM